MTTAEAARLLAEVGPNELQAAKPISALRLLMDQFKNVLVIILLLATAVSAILGHEVEAIAITIIVLFSVALGFVQEFRAERAIEALKQLTAPTATVIRDGEEVEIPARDVVPGDVLILETGDRVAADGVLTLSASLHAMESALTGESVPVQKQAPEDHVFAGTVITMGRGQARVTATGMRTEFGKIATMLSTVEVGKTPLQTTLDRLGTTLGKAALVVIAIIVGIGLFRGQDFIEIFIFGIALAVAVVPEALPAVVTISLALGVQRLVKRQALMRRLPAVETLGSTSVICSDKTGTLTKDEMTVRIVWTSDVQRPSSNAFLGTSDAGRRTLTAATLCCDAHAVHDPATQRWKVKGDPTEAAIVIRAMQDGLHKEELERQHPRIAEFPFTSERKRMTTIHQREGGHNAYSKGAPEVIVASCDLDEADRAVILEQARVMASQALRVLAVAEKDVFDPHAPIDDHEQGMTFVGLIGMMDPPREEAAQALRTCEQAGIRVIMITGDHPITAQAVARELGVFRHDRVITGVELTGMTEADLETVIDDVDVYARVAPSHKLRLVEMLQRKGHVVAMTGDGVNDAPALRKADIGVAMGITGTDVAKEAADMTLTNDNFASIVAAVEEGRGIFGNIKKYLMFLLSSNIGEIGLIAVSAMMGLPAPLTAVQLLYINLATDGLPALALAVDPPENDLMQQQPRDTKHGIFTRRVRFLMIAGGVWSTIINLGVYLWAENSGKEHTEAMTMTFVSLILVQFFKAYSFRSDHVSTFTKPFANRWLNYAVVWELIMLLGVVYIPALHLPFGTFSLTVVDWIVVVLAALTILPLLEVVKRRHA